MRAVSLFSNCGAGDVGFASAGFRFAVVSELIEKRLGVAVMNHPGATAVAGDLRQTWPDVVDAFREARGAEAPVLLSGCPPCQGMSSARGDRGRESDPDAGTRDGRNLLVLPIAEVARELRPTFVVVENVPAFLRRKVWDPEGATPLTAARILCDRLASDYRAYAAILDLCEFGVPQHRWRAFLTLVRKDSEAHDTLERTERAPFPSPTHGVSGRPPYITIDDALEALALPALDAASAETARSDDDAMHRVPIWPERRYGMVAAIPPGTGASAWETDHCEACDESSIPSTDPLCPRCGTPLPRPTVRDEDGSWRLIRGFRHSSYRRMDPTRPAATITTASGHVGSDRTLHPWENRVLSPAECAWLQTFPGTFRWGNALETCGHTGVRRMIGEAVPPRFTKLHGRVLAALAEGRDLPGTLSQHDGRCRKALSKLGSREPSGGR